MAIVVKSKNMIVDGNNCIQIEQPKIYQQKDIMVEAVQLILDNIDEVLEWCGGELWETKLGIIGIKKKQNTNLLHINFYDYVIKGVNGYFYKCDSATFEAFHR